MRFGKGWRHRPDWNYEEGREKKKILGRVLKFSFHVYYEWHCALFTAVEQTGFTNHLKLQKSLLLDFPGTPGKDEAK